MLVMMMMVPPHYSLSLDIILLSYTYSGGVLDQIQTRNNEQVSPKARAGPRDLLMSAPSDHSFINVK